MVKERPVLRIVFREHSSSSTLSGSIKHLSQKHPQIRQNAHTIHHLGPHGQPCPPCNTSDRILRSNRRQHRTNRRELQSSLDPQGLQHGLHVQLWSCVRRHCLLVRRRMPSLVSHSSIFFVDSAATPFPGCTLHKLTSHIVARRRRPAATTSTLRSG